MNITLKIYKLCAQFISDIKYEYGATLLKKCKKATASVAFLAKSDGKRRFFLV